MNKPLVDKEGELVRGFYEGENKFYCDFCGLSFPQHLPGCPCGKEAA